MEKYKTTIMSNTGQVYSETSDYAPQPNINWAWHSVRTAHGTQSGFVLKIERLLDEEKENNFDGT